MNLEKIAAELEWARQAQQRVLKPGTENTVENIRYYQGGWLLTRLNTDGEVDWLRSSACIAAHTVLTAGAVVDPDSYDWSYQYGPSNGVHQTSILYEGASHAIPTLAGEILELSSREYSKLFEANQTLEDLEYVVEKWQMEQALSDRGWLLV